MSVLNALSAGSGYRVAYKQETVTIPIKPGNDFRYFTPQTRGNKQIAINSSSLASRADSSLFIRWPKKWRWAAAGAQQRASKDRNENIFALITRVLMLRFDVYQSCSMKKPPMIGKQ